MTSHFYTLILITSWTLIYVVYCKVVCGMLKCYRIIERGSDDEYGTREFVNELDIKECRLVQTATGRCCIRFVAHIIWWCWSWFNEWYTRFSGIEGQVNESLEVMRSLFLKLEWPDIIFYNPIATWLSIQQDRLFNLGLVSLE